MDQRYSIVLLSIYELWTCENENERSDELTEKLLKPIKIPFEMSRSSRKFLLAVRDSTRGSPGRVHQIDGARWVGVSKNKLFWPGIGRRPWRDKRRNYAKRSPRRLANDCKCGGKKDGSASPSRATFQEAVPRPCLVWIGRLADSPDASLSLSLSFWLSISFSFSLFGSAPVHARRLMVRAAAFRHAFIFDRERTARLSRNHRLWIFDSRIVGRNCFDFSNDYLFFTD